MVDPEPFPVFDTVAPEPDAPAPLAVLVLPIVAPDAVVVASPVVIDALPVVPVGVGFTPTAVAEVLLVVLLTSPSSRSAGSFVGVGVTVGVIVAVT